MTTTGRLGTKTVAKGIIRVRHSNHHLLRTFLIPSSVIDKDNMSILMDVAQRRKYSLEMEFPVNATWAAGQVEWKNVADVVAELEKSEA